MVLGSLKGAPSEAFQGTDEEAKAEEDSDFLCIAGTWGALETRVCAWVPGLSLPQPKLSCTRTLVSVGDCGHLWNCRSGSCCIPLPPLSFPCPDQNHCSLRRARPGLCSQAKPSLSSHCSHQPCPWHVTRYSLSPQSCPAATSPPCPGHLCSSPTACPLHASHDPHREAPPSSPT